MSFSTKESEVRKKMRLGELYHPGDPELVEARDRAQELCNELNTLKSSKTNDRAIILKKLIPEISKGVYIRPPFHVDYGFNIKIGPETEFNMNCVILDCARVEIGAKCLFGPGVQIFTVGHPLEAKLRETGVEHAKPITIGRNVWIGGGAILLPGVLVGENAVIGAGSVVTKDVPPNTLVAGNPAKIIRLLT